MTTFFKSPKSGIAVMELSVLGDASGFTGELTSVVAVCDNNQGGPGRSLAELTRHLVSHPGDDAALSAVCMAVRDGAEIEELVALLQSCSNAGDSFADHATAELAFRIATGASDAHARELCRTALDLCPVHVAALSLFEKLADASWTDELCARYQMFLEDGPAHGVSPDICETVANKLADLEQEATLTLEGLDDVHQPDLWDLLKRALARTVPEVDSVAARFFLDVPAMQA